MQVGVEHLLERGLAVGQKQVDPIAWQPGCSKRRGQPCRNRIHTQIEVFGDLSEQSVVLVRDDDQVARRDRGVVEEGRHAIIAIDHAGLCSTRCDVTEDAVVRGSNP